MNDSTQIPQAWTGDFADFYALMPPDNSPTVPAGGNIQFPRNGPAQGPSIIRDLGPSPDKFRLVTPGFYQVFFDANVIETAQLVLTLNGVQLLSTVAGRNTGGTFIGGMRIIRTTIANSILSVTNSTGYTIRPEANGGPLPVSAHLTILRLK